MDGSTNATTKSLQPHFQSVDGQTYTLTNGVPYYTGLAQIIADRTGLVQLMVRGRFNDTTTTGQRLIGYNINKSNVQDEWIDNIGPNNTDYKYFNDTILLYANKGDVFRLCAYNASGVTASLYIQAFALLYL